MVSEVRNVCFHSNVDDQDTLDVSCAGERRVEARERLPCVCGDKQGTVALVLIGPRLERRQPEADDDPLTAGFSPSSSVRIQLKPAPNHLACESLMLWGNLFLHACFILQGTKPSVLQEVFSLSHSTFLLHLMTSKRQGVQDLPGV